MVHSRLWLAAVVAATGCSDGDGGAGTGGGGASAGTTDAGTSGHDAPGAGGTGSADELDPATADWFLERLPGE